MKSVHSTLTTNGMRLQKLHSNLRSRRLAKRKLKKGGLKTAAIYQTKQGQTSKDTAKLSKETGRLVSVDLSTSLVMNIVGLIRAVLNTNRKDTTILNGTNETHNFLVTRNRTYSLILISITHLVALLANRSLSATQSRKLVRSSENIAETCRSMTDNRRKSSISETITANKTDLLCNINVQETVSLLKTVASSRRDSTIKKKSS